MTRRREVRIDLPVDSPIAHEAARDARRIVRATAESMETRSSIVLEDDMATLVNRFYAGQQGEPATENVEYAACLLRSLALAAVTCAIRTAGPEGFGDVIREVTDALAAADDATIQGRGA